MWKTGIQLAAHALLIADAFLLYRYLGTESSWIEIGIAHTAAILTIGLPHSSSRSCARRMTLPVGILH